MNTFYTILVFILTALIAYLIGSIPTAVLISKTKGVDITSVGSHNAGGTNVGRSVGKKWGILTMFLDGLKCYIPCLVCLLILTFCPLPLLHFQGDLELYVTICALFVAIGHSYPVFNHFQGGKCVACFAGYLFLVAPLIMAIGCIAFFSILAWKKRVSLASLVGATLAFLASLVPMILDLTILKETTDYNGGMYFSSAFMLHLSYITTIAVFLYVLLIYIRHKSNLKRLYQHTEPETHFKKN